MPTTILTSKLKSSFHKNSSFSHYHKSKHSRICAYDVVHEPFPLSYMKFMEATEHVQFLRATNAVVFSVNNIRWASKHNDKISVCIHPDGCAPTQLFDVSKESNPEDYTYLENLLGFDKEDK